MSTTAPLHQEVTWNEATDGYIGPKVPQTTALLHSDSDDGIDPISYEVIRHALWNVNIEHGETILKVFLRGVEIPQALLSHILSLDRLPDFCKLRADLFHLA